MISLFTDYYFSIKTLHILFMISWMATVFYLPRIFVHIAEGQQAGEDTRRLFIMAHKLKGFMSVMMILTIIFGVILAVALNSFSQAWLHAKLTLIFLLIGYQHYCFWHLKQLKNETSQYSSKFFRFLNEAPLILIIPIIYLVVAKPFI